MKETPRLTALEELSASESAKIERAFSATGDGRAALLARSALADRLVLLLHDQLFSGTPGGPQEVCLVALGGYGRQALFPHSDVDLLVLGRSSAVEAAVKDPAARLGRALWDLGWRTSATIRTLDECERFEQGNPEFTFSLLDCRYLAGDARILTDLRETVVPGLAARERSALLNSLMGLTRERHSKYGDTIFHLEPNVKETPGGLRDYDVACWLTLLLELARNRRWPSGEAGGPQSFGDDVARAFAFLCDSRVFLHYHNGRDDNRLSWELQDAAATLGIGHRRETLPPDRWMRSYFRHAREVSALASRLLDEASIARPSLYSAIESWRSRLSNADFCVLRGRIFPRQPAALEDPATLLGLFEFQSRHGLALNLETEAAVERSVSRLAGRKAVWTNAWRQFRRILVLPHAAAALRAMHRLGVLDTLFPEFGAIDALVVRDLYHRYTVDEHTFLAIQNLHALRATAGDPERRLAEIRSELEQPELLYLALLFHDVGKGLPGEDHVRNSLAAVEGVFGRLGLAEEERELVRFLIRNHLEMSATLQRRDIFDPETVRAFAEKAGTPERLKLLCLLTYADVKSVNPEALTPWKAEMLWRLYAAAVNHLARSVEEDRVHAVPASEWLSEIRRHLPVNISEGEVSGFLEGFPRRYLLTHTPPQVAAHLGMAQRLEKSPVELRLESRGPFYELVVVTRDRPRLFASLTGALAGWGMNIVKADAYGNSAGMVVDTVRFEDTFRTLDLNPEERQRFVESVADVLGGRRTLESLLRGRMRRAPLPRPKVEIQPEARFDNSSSSHSTVLEIVARDRPGLLHEISSVLAGAGMNIEVALVDTQGEKALDVFYLTIAGRKLEQAEQDFLRDALLRCLQ